MSQYSVPDSSGSSGTVTTLSVVTANGLAGSVADPTTTPAITLTTSVTGVLKGNGTAISAATSGSDYAPATSGSAILKGSGSGGFSAAVAGTDYGAATNPKIATQSVVTGSRAVDGTVYQNTGTTPLFCTVTVNNASGTSVTFSTDAATPPTVAVADISVAGTGTNHGTVSFWVLPGNYYKAVQSGGAALVRWVEWS